MSLKDLFNSPNLKSVASASLQDVIDDTESLGYIESYVKEQNQFRTNLDFSSAENFVRFGSAEKYYVDSIERIYKTFPYDGSRKEKVEFFLSSSDLDMYIFENEYPRTNGYANFLATLGAPAEATVFYTPSHNEYILVKGGPNTSTRAKDKEITDTSGDYKDGYANTYNLSKNRENNLKIGGIDGNTVEFWLKKDVFGGPTNSLEFIVDAHVTGSSIGDHDYGRLSIALANEFLSSKTFYVNYASGSDDIKVYLGSPSLGIASVADGKWHHYAVRMKTVDSNTVFDLFVDGEHNDTTSTNTTINYVSGNIVATIGSQAAPASIVSSPTPADIGGERGWSPFSGSLDEFRYWKVWRDSQEIGRQYIEPIGAGTNTDDANTHLGVYFKFNEGITQTASIDATVLDYSGRISNGVWTGYDSSYSRETGSAFVESGKAPFEFKDPILYSFHPDVVNLLNSKRSKGEEYDYRNPNSIYKSIPSWITDQEYGKENPALENLTQIISSYFDTLHSQIENLSSLKHTSYTSGTADKNQKPFFFNNRILQSYGFPYIPDLFQDASFIEYFRNRDDKVLYEEKLYDIKNTIYNNIYNNLIYINKSKGTEKAFRNFFRCFGVDDKILKLRYYSNNGEFEYLDNVISTSENKKYVNFSLTGAAEATVYQYKTYFSLDESTSFIYGSNNAATGLESTGYGFTVECQAIFPHIPTQAEYNTFLANSDHTGGKIINSFTLDKKTSIYGLRTAKTTENDTTVPTADRAGFIVKSIRDNEFDKRCKFELTPTNNSYFPTITTPYFEDVFDETKWNFAVTVKPTNYGKASFISGSEDVDTYDVVFMGTRVILGETLDNFELSSTISNTFGKTILTRPKRVFIGAERDNVSGSLVTRANSSITDCRYWLKPITFSELKKHNTDIQNYGVDNPHDSAYLFQDDLTEIRVSNIETLALHWNFLNVTSSDENGRFDVSDFSSGSSDADRFGDLSNILLKQHSGRGDYFVPSFAGTFSKKNVYNAKTDLPGYINSSDMINITNFDDMTFTRETRPISYFMTIEKSMYQTISQDMIQIFSTMVDYGSLVGKQYSKYRVENKDLKQLRKLFFQRISNIPKIEKYVDYYKWFDTSLNILIENLIPVTALRNENSSFIRPVIEEHVFNKEKYVSKFPSLKEKKPNPDGAAVGGAEAKYSYELGSAPIEAVENINGLWYKERSERDNPAISSGDAGVDADRQQILNVITSLTDGSAPNLRGNDGSYEGSSFAIKRLSRPYELSADVDLEVAGGSNSKSNQKIGFWDALRTTPTPDGATEGGLIAIEADRTLNEFPDLLDNLELNRGKRKFTFSAGYSKDGQQEFIDVVNGQLIYPFSLYSSSLDTNPSRGTLTNFRSNLDITNLHHDNYAPYNDVPMQGPFTERFVGGRPYRHVMTNFTTDNATPDAQGERLEGWKISASSDTIDLSNPDTPKSVFFREEYAKRPVNIKNIRQLTSSEDTGDQYTDAFGVTRIGNFSNTYELVMLSGRSINNRYLIKSDGLLPETSQESTAVSGVFDFSIPRRDLTGSNKTIVVNRFSAPGDSSTMSEGFLDIAAAELSVYNALPFRNLSVRQPLQELLADHSNQFGLFSDARTIADYDLYNQVYSPQKSYPGGGSGTGIPANATAILEVTDAGGIRDGETFRLVNTAGVETTYRFNAGVAHGSQPGGTAGGTVQLGFGGVGGGATGKINVAAAIVASIAATTDAGFTAVSDGVSKVTVTQTIKGVEGDKNNTDSVVAGLTVGNFTGGQTTTVDYDGTGSFHKVNRNGRKQPRYSNIYIRGEATIEIDTANDNFFVQHQIPQTDVQYSWITSSLTDDYSGSALYGFEQPDFSNSSLASSDILFASASDSGSGDLKVDYAGLNTLVLDEVLSTSNLLSSSDYFNDKIGALEDVLTTNAVLLHRQGTYGGSNWKLYKKNNHPIVRTHKKENRLSFLQTILHTNLKGETVKTTAIQSRIESPVTNKYRPVEFSTTITDPKLGETQDISFQQTYLNDFSRFSNNIPGENDFSLNSGEYFRTVKKYKEKESTYVTIKDMVNKKLSDEVNPILSTSMIKTEEVFWPKQQYTYLSDHRQREQFANLFWRDDAETRRILGSPTPEEFFVRETPQYSIPAKDLFRFGNNLGRGTGFPSDTLYFQPENSGTFSASIWPLDSRKNFETNSPGRIRSGTNEGVMPQISSAPNFTFRPYISASDGSGILQNAVVPFSSYLYAEHSHPSSSPFFIGIQPTDALLYPQYNRRIQGSIAADTAHEYKFGDTKWEAGEQSGLAPFYDIYSDYIEDIKRLGKDHSIIPEFRISQHMDYYLNNAKDFLVKPPGAYEITGTAVSSSANTEFEKTYLHSDFIKTFSIVNEDFDSLENTKITLSADALIKFLPYDGFYPADRTVQIARLFHESYQSSFAITGAVRPQGIGSDSIKLGETLGSRQRGFMNPVFKPLFAPGILYNSIKSGLAVDYPIHTSDTTVTTTGTPNQRNGLGYLIDIPRISSNFDYRVPFEALADPVGTIGGVNIIDNEPHPSASINLTASLGGSGKLNYVLAMNNFLASTIDFFKEDGKLTTLASISDEDPKFGIGTSDTTDSGGFQPGKEYKMRIVCYNGIFNTLASIGNYLSNSSFEAYYNASYNNTSPLLINYAQTGSDSNPRADYYGSAFGPPVKSVSTLMQNDSVDRNYSSASYEPFTPPYYDGYSHIELTYRPEFNDDNLHTIISQLTQSFTRLSTGIVESDIAGDDRMRLSASLNYLQVVQQPSVKYDANGRVLEVDDATAGNVLTIQPKWECPILNFKNVDVTLPEIGSGSVARGMWHQYGQLPAEGEGVYLQIQDLDPSEISDPSLTGSLADKLGFRKEPVRIGEIARQKKISEAIVAIPFRETVAGTNIKQFYKIDRQTIKAAIAEVDSRPVDVLPRLAPSEEIVNMVRKMKKFVIPPHLDFVSNGTINPFAMFIFDFEVTLKQQDLANIWQNLSPNLGRKAIKSNATLPVNIFSANESDGAPLLSIFDKDTRWMVFKVKQRAAFNYFAKTADSSDDERFKFNFEFGSRNAERASVPDYSYNWPFDFFSLIELAKVSAEHEFHNKDEDDTR